MEGTMEILVKKTVILFGRILLLSVFINTTLALSSCTDKKLNVPYYNDASFTPIWHPDNSEIKKLHTIAPFTFVNQYGNPVTNNLFKGKVYLVSFFFTTCPGICPKLTQTMKMVYNNFRKNSKVLLLSHSVTPDIDTPDRLYKYAEKNNILSQQWQLVTGERSEIYTIARKSYFIEEEMGLSKLTGQFLHTENLVLIDDRGHIRGIYNGTLQAEVPRITEDIKSLIN
jgi:protein SCO1